MLKTTLILGVFLGVLFANPPYEIEHGSYTKETISSYTDYTIGAYSDTITAHITFDDYGLKEATQQKGLTTIPEASEGSPQQLHRVPFEILVIRKDDSLFCCYSSTKTYKGISTAKAGAEYPTKLPIVGTVLYTGKTCTLHVATENAAGVPVRVDSVWHYKGIPLKKVEVTYISGAHYSTTVTTTSTISADKPTASHFEIPKGYTSENPERSHATALKLAIQDSLKSKSLDERAMTIDELIDEIERKNPDHSITFDEQLEMMGHGQ